MVDDLDKTRIKNEQTVVRTRPGVPTTPSRSRPTGSNWGRPDQWSESQLGPIGPGTVIKQRFVIESKLGQGGMGIVFKARDLRKEEAQDSDPHIAIKILNEEFRHHPQALISLQREASKAQTLAHPNIVTVSDFDRDGTTVYMTMELMRGKSLSQINREHRHTGVTREDALPIIKGMAEGLAYAHTHSIVHSDFKPGNVFVTDEGRVKVLDFGIARTSQFVGSAKGSDTVFDAGDLGALTPGYASLEMLKGKSPHPADDVYALAATSYQLLAGRHPFDRKTAAEALEAGLVPKPISGLKRREWRAIANGLALRRRDRLRDAAAFLDAFRGPTPVRKSMYAAMAGLVLLAVFFGYRSTLNPPGPFPENQREPFEASMRLGREAFAMARGDPLALAAAASEFGLAFEIHPRNPDAVRWLERTADELLRNTAPAAMEATVANLVCQGNLGRYKPVARACDSLGREVCDALLTRCTSGNAQ